MPKKSLLFLFFFLLSCFCVGAPPVPFSGKLAVDGKNFHGNALFAFSIVDGEGAVHWKHAQENNATIENFVLNGRYIVLLGGQGMQALPAYVFLKHDSLFLRVSVDLKDGKGLRLLEPDQPITSTPYALAAELARLAEKASVADGVTPGAITAGMIDAELLADLNKTITISDLPEEVVESMNRPITREMLPQDVRDDLNRTIGVAQLSAEVNEKLNRDFTIQPGSISKSLLGQDVLGDLNRTILRHHLSEELRAELNRTIRLRDLAPEVLADLNDSIAPGSITLDMLASGVRADLNRTITKSMLSQEIKDDLNRTIGVAQLSAEVSEMLNRDFTIQPGSISKSLLGQDVLGDLNRTVRLQDLSEEVSQSINRPITREMLPQGVRDDLNATITRNRLSADVRADLNRTIRLRDLAPEVIADLNDSIAPGSITLDMLASGVRADLNRTIGVAQLSTEVNEKLNRDFTIQPGSISKSLLGQDVLLDLNRTVRLQDLSEEVSQSINRPITREMLPQGVRDDLNATITRNRLSADVRADLNRTIGIANLSSEVTDKLNQTFSIDAGSISLDQLSQQVRDELNATITRDRLSSDVLADLNRTVRLQDLSPEVSQSINRSISLNDLDSQVITELNNSITPSSITLDLLSSQVRNDLNRTITKSMLSQEVLNELNSSSGGGGVVPGSLLAVPRNQPAPSGYSLYQSGEPKDLVWEEKAPITLARSVFDCVSVINDKIYLAGGWNGDKQKVAEVYDPTTNEWSSISSMSIERSDAAVATLNGKLFAMGGKSQAGAILSSVEKYDESSNTWLSSTSLPSARWFISSISHGGKIFCAGGLNSSSVLLRDFITFDEVSNTWAELSDMLTARRCLKMVYYNDRIWAIGGNDGSHTNKVESYDPTTDSWQVETSLITAREYPVAWVANGRIYVGGGHNGSSFLNSIEVYDPATKQWTSAGNFPENKHAADAVVLNDKAYVVAGQTGDGVWSNKVFAADLNASVSGVFDLYRKDGNASGGVPTVQAVVADGSISLSKLSSEVRNDLNRTITKSMLSQEVLNELNSSSGGGGVLPGSLLAVPKNQSAPLGYSLFQSGEIKDLVWEEKAPVSVARYASDGVEALDGKIYFVGGYTDSSNYDITERYDPLSNTWENLANMSAARAGVACAVLNGKLYAIGGVGLSSVEVFDPSNGTWSAGIALPSEVNRGSAITVDGNIYLIGGRNASSQRINQVLCFDPSISQWSTKANMPTAREAIKPVWFENRIWAIGGYDGSPLNLVESYDPTTDTWQVEASLTIARSWPVAWVANGRIYAGGGYQSSFLNSIEVYDPMTKQWTSAGNFLENKHAADAVVLNDKAYVVAGATASGVYSNKVFAADLNASVEGVHDLYVKTGDASTGTPTVQAEVADGSITTNQLSEQILKYLKPEITQQPTAGTIFADTNSSISVSAEGKYLTYQWKKNGANLSGETNATLTITDANSTQHDGNYSVVISNDFGSVESGEADMDVWNVGDDTSNVSLWLDASNVGSFELSNSVIQNWRDLSGNGNDMNISNGNPSLTGQLHGKTVAAYDGDDTTATTKNFSNDLDQSGYSIVALSRYAGNPRFRVISSGSLRNWLLGHHGGKHSTFFAENWVDSGTTGDLNWHIFSVTHEPAISYNNGVAPLSSFWLDGTNRAQNSGASSDTAPSPSDIVFGGVGEERSNCEVAEFIMIAAEISDTKRQEIEGYLAHKWGLRPILPNNHFYK